MLCLRALPRSNRGFTIVEVLSTAFILIVVFAALFSVLNVGEFSNTVSSAKADLQAKVRTAMDSILKDVRQTSIIQINSNDPSPTHIKFKKVTGIDNTTGSYSLSDNYIEYTYDADLLSLVRNEVNAGGTVLKSQTFNDITEAPFYSSTGVPLVAGGILSSKKLVLVVAGKNNIRGGLNLSFSLTEEVKVRNE